MMRASSNHSTEGSSHSMHPLTRTMWRLGALVAAPLAVGLGFAITTGVADAATAAGTPITNTATASYSDGTNTYTSQSNTVTTTVQNAPSETITPTAGTGSVVDGQTVTVPYIVTNTGNGSGYFQIPGTLGTNDGVTAGTGATFVNFTVNSNTYTTIAALNTYLATQSISSGSTETISVVYTVGSTETGTVTTNVVPTLTYAAGTGTTQQTTGTVTGQQVDTISADARIDVQKTAAVSGTVAAPVVTYSLRFANGGSKILQPVDTGSLPTGVPQGCTAGANPCGVFFSDKIPSFSGTQLTLDTAVTPTVTGTTGTTILYSTNGTSWTTTQTGAVYIGVFVPAAQITGGSLATFQFNNNASTTNNVTVAQASLTLGFAINGYTGASPGAGNATAITNIANSVFADNAGYIEGAGVTPLTNLNNGSSTTTANSTVTNTTTPTQDSGYIASPATPTVGAVLNGPNGQPAAVGPTNNNDDYTGVSYTNGGAILTSTNGQTESVPASAAAITYTNSVDNTSNKFDTYTLTAATASGDQALPTGWTVKFVSTGTPATANCPLVAAGTVITTICVESLATLTYNTVYTPPASSTTFTNYLQYGDAITATSANTPASNNITEDEFVVGGYVKLVKSFLVAGGKTCATAISTDFVTATTALPGDCVKYTIAYSNVMPSGGTNNSTVSATSVVVSENGSGTGTTNSVAYTNNWFANSVSGLYATPVDSNGGTLAGYTPGPTAPGSSTFTDTIASLAAGASGTVYFEIQIK